MFLKKAKILSVATLFITSLFSYASSESIENNPINLNTNDRGVHYYFSMVNGPVFFSSSSKDVKSTSGFTTGAALGLQLASLPVRAELYYNYIKQTDTTTNVYLSTFIMQGYYDLQWVSKKFVPYIGAGVGMTHISGDSFSKKNKPAFSVKAGFTRPVTENLSLGLGYTYQYTKVNGYDLNNQIIGIHISRFF